MSTAFREPKEAELHEALPSRFTSRYSGYQLIVKQPEMDYSLGYERLIRPIVVADFAEGGWAGEYEDRESGTTYQALDGGGFLDTEESAARNGWTREEELLVRYRLCQLSPNHTEQTDLNRRITGYGDVYIYVPPKAEPPWKNYDRMSLEKILEFAADTEQYNEAFIYEQRTRNDEWLMERLGALCNAEIDLVAE